MTGIVKGYEIIKNRDGKNNVVMLQCEINGSRDVQSVEYFHPVGDNSIPVIDSVVIILEAGRSWKIAVAQNDQKDFKSGLNEGEKYLYSKDENSFIKLLNDGTIEINGNSRDTARKDDTTELVMSGVDVQSLAALLLTTGAFTPTGSPPIATTQITFTGGKITSGNDKVKQS